MRMGNNKIIIKVAVVVITCGMLIGCGEVSPKQSTSTPTSEITVTSTPTLTVETTLIDTPTPEPTKKVYEYNPEEDTETNTEQSMPEPGQKTFEGALSRVLKENVESEVYYDVAIRAYAPSQVNEEEFRYEGVTYDEYRQKLSELCGSCENRLELVWGYQVEHREDDPLCEDKEKFVSELRNLFNRESNDSEPQLDLDSYQVNDVEELIECLMPVFEKYGPFAAAYEKWEDDVVKMRVEQLNKNCSDGAEILCKQLAEQGISASVERIYWRKNDENNVNSGIVGELDLKIAVVRALMTKENLENFETMGDTYYNVKFSNDPLEGYMYSQQC